MSFLLNFDFAGDFLIANGILDDHLDRCGGVVIDVGKLFFVEAINEIDGVRGGEDRGEGAGVIGEELVK